MANAVTTIPPPRFQSSSSPKTGCKLEASTSQTVVVVLVSILIQPEDRMQGGGQGVDAQLAIGVSILIQPEDRMQDAAREGASYQELFQSSSSPKTGCKVGVDGFTVLLPPVSILIQPEDRMQAAPTTSVTFTVTCFNPHPARRPDASPKYEFSIG